jgi:catechol 2,3-dioxygenase
MATSDRPDGGASLPAALRLGPVHVLVTDLDRSLDWYETALGLQVHRRENGQAEFGDGIETVVVLHEDESARPVGRHAGLYHYALLYPSRSELGRAALRLGVTRTPIQGMSDPGTHEAIYLPDPDGNGVELAADRPRDQWPDVREDYLRGGGPRPLDIRALLDVVRDEQPPPHVGEGLRVGHVHLHVGDIPAAFAFYRDVLGFEEQADMGMAGFVSAGGYHHHVGFNTWRGQGIGPAPEHTIGLEHWTMELPTHDDVAATRTRLQAAGVDTVEHPNGFRAEDPWRIPFTVVSGLGG